jgi:indolepyruvate ferredoxin oxidoreductase beta subunit
MSAYQLRQDPYNLIITGVGGQGNVLSSRMLGNMLTSNGYYITIGETFGASQRGGSVMSHVRISQRSAWSPQIPGGKAHLVIALEPSEAFRVLSAYGNPKTLLIWNTRPIYPVSVISGETQYPGQTEIRQRLAVLTERNWSLNATEKAMDLGNAIFANIIMLGALSELGLLPFSREDFTEVLTSTLPSDKVSINLDAFDSAAALLQETDNTRILHEN